MIRPRFRPGTCRFLAVFLPSVLLLATVIAVPVWSLETGVEVGQPVPEFSLPGLNGVPVSFEKQIRGKAPLTLLFFDVRMYPISVPHLKII